MTNAREARENAAGERSRILKSMKKWEEMDAPARLLGRGLGRKELLGRVAKDVGATIREVSTVLKKTHHE